MKNKLQFELAHIIMGEIEKANDIIDAYMLYIALNGNIDIKLEYQCSNGTVLMTCEKYSNSRINTVAYPRDWIRDQIRVLIKSLRIGLEKEEISNDQEC